jgi:hypothetical protein
MESRMMKKTAPNNTMSMEEKRNVVVGRRKHTYGGRSRVAACETRPRDHCVLTVEPMIYVCAHFSRLNCLNYLPNTLISWVSQ